MYFKFLDGKEKNNASGLISGQKYGSHFTALLASGISYPIWFFFFFFFYDVNNLFIYVHNLNLFLFIIVFLLVRMRFHLNTLFEISRRIALWSA